MQAPELHDAMRLAVYAPGLRSKYTRRLQSLRSNIQYHAPTLCASLCWSLGLCCAWGWRCLVSTDRRQVQSIDKLCSLIHAKSANHIHSPVSCATGGPLFKHTGTHACWLWLWLAAVSESRVCEVVCCVSSPSPSPTARSSSLPLIAIADFAADNSQSVLIDARAGACKSRESFSEA